MIRENIENAGIFCLLIALLITICALITEILQEYFNVLQGFDHFSIKFMIFVAFLVILGVTLSIIDKIVNKKENIVLRSIH